MRDTVCLKGMRFHSRVGVLPHEEQLPQPVEVDLSVTVDETVRPPNVVDYVALYSAVAGVMGVRHISYLEEAAERVATAALRVTGVGGYSLGSKAACAAAGTGRNTQKSASPASEMDDVAFVALGSNMGDRRKHLSDALARIGMIPGVAVIQASRIEETEPIGDASRNRTSTRW